METKERNVKKWISLAAMVSVLFILQFSVLISAGIATTIMPEYGLTPAQFGMITNMPFLAGVIFGIICGNLGDRFGIKRMMTIGLIVFLLGAIWRSFCTGFGLLCISSLVMGYGIAVLNSNSTKGIRLWFPGEAMGIAMGIYVCGASIGAGIALKVGSLYTRTAPAYRLCIVLAAIALVLWIALYRTHPSENQEKEAVSLKQFGAVIKNRNVWIVSIMILFIFGCSTTQQTYMNAALSERGGGNLAYASTISLISTIAVAAGSILMPAVIARFKKFRPIMCLMCLGTAVLLLLVFVLPFGVPTIILFILQGATLGSMLAMAKTVPALLPDIDPANLGAVGGLQSTLQNVGAWIVAGYIIAPICQVAFPSALYFAIYAGSALCAVLAAITILFLPKDLPTKRENN